MEERKQILNKFFRGDRGIWIIIAFLVAISFVEVYSSLQANTLVRNGDYNSQFYKHVVLVAGGIVLTSAITNVGIKRLFTSNLYIAVVLGALVSWVMLILTPIFGSHINGASRTFMGVQWSELIKVFYVIFLSFWIGTFRNSDALEPSRKGWICLALVFLLSVVPIGLENASGFMLLTVVSLVLLSVGGAKWKAIFSIVGLGLLLVTGVVAIGATHTSKELRESSNPILRVFHRSPTWVARGVRAFDSVKETNKEDKYVVNDGNYQVSHAKMAVANSNFIGKGVAGGIERSRLPQAFSDYIFSIIIEEGGVVAFFVIIICYLCILWRSIVIAIKSENIVYAMIVLGCALLIVFQALVNMAVGVALGDFVTGQPLPLVSKGGTSVIMTCVLFGLILAISDHAKSLEEKKKNKKIVVEPAE
ncbi:MAG: FtsW/RodA/SpoVE family cell cycle protein [Paludibacteraceae bacterium]|nr:FtsW/RodA/SpoVE family cell cycle protein [Paludibacteraceae bacterium]